MKKVSITILVGLLSMNTQVYADTRNAEKLTPLQKARIARAIQVLVDTKTIDSPYSQCVQFDQDILSTLESEGLIQTGTVQPQTICVGPK